MGDSSDRGSIPLDSTNVYFNFFNKTLGVGMQVFDADYTSSFMLLIPAIKRYMSCMDEIPFSSTNTFK